MSDENEIDRQENKRADSNSPADTGAGDALSQGGSGAANVDISEDFDFEVEENPVNRELSAKVRQLPLKPGVYIYKDKDGRIIYVGKAKALRNRVRSYFRANRPMDAKTKALVAKIADLDYIVVDSEAEALILEDTLIKKHKPRYNVLLKDDKTYPYVRVTNEPYPRLFVTRHIVRDGSKYYGPFTEVHNMKQIMHTLRAVFQLRSCDLYITSETIAAGKHKVCLDYHINKCEGPCEGYISREEYSENVANAVQVLLGKTRELEKKLELVMAGLAEEMKFEAAAKVRNRLMILKEYTSKQKIVSTDLVDRDVFGLARQDDTACAFVFKIRDGKMTGKRHFIIKNALGTGDDKIIQRTVETWYLEGDFVPREIYLPCEPDDTEYLMGWLSGLRGKGVSIFIPQIGDKKKLVEMASTNAEYALKEYLLAIEKREQAVPRAVLSLERDLGMKRPPRRIECFDNSHIQGSELVSSLVVFEDGRPKKSDYRKFKIQTVHQNDDFATMQEVVRRRYSRLIEEKQTLPDLVIIDGGKGQLSSAYAVLKDLGIEDKLVVIGLAKRLEEVFFPGESEPQMLPRTSSSLKLIQ